ncbi:DUF4163 domain-containing protein [Sphingomonas daechungensis]|uniref:DUF4163 domain-containing protein n=1 Tax=Sphingomonas daechungensis TaxID=1176646 RepID=A0ABX6T085_9SPHN|nr:DUF4163 domain-containing protein [Sphingomonas daechungensis]QNP42931.1 DUF4163 domain-containing protein [Sphingomonas daechungensis]
MRASVIMLVALAACGQQSAPSSVEENRARPASSQQVRSSPQPIVPAAKPFKVEEETSLYSFAYSWPAEASAVPELVARFTKDKDETKAELIAGAKEDRDGRLKDGYDYHAHETQKHYETEGQSERLLSLESNVYAFTGGAHGSSGSGSLLWDRELKREISIQDLLQPGQSWTGAIRQPFCILLNREREKRREEPVKPDDLFGNCPEWKELTVLVTDTDKNGRFDHITVIADQYVAGPYAEGDYEITLPITATMIDRLKPEYRSSFEPRPPVE